MSKAAAALQFLKKETLELIPPMVFFFVLFEIVVVVRSLLGSGLDVSMTSTGAAFIGALIVGKAILIIDATPLFHWFREPRLVYNLLWRVFLYTCLALLFQLLEELIPLYRQTGSWSTAMSSFGEEVDWVVFWATHLFLVIFVTFYALITTLVELVGEERLLALLFSRKAG